MNKEVKLSLFTDNLIVYTDNLKESTHQKTLKNLIYELDKVQNIKSIQNANSHLYNSSKE